jgi:NosR/NirI family transcriptional regulator, nitrous oxide reductase regulator
MGLFIARPYCRFFVRTEPFSMFFPGSAAGTCRFIPTKCIQCKLCTTSCPFEAIDFPDEEKIKPDKRTNTRKFILYAALIPVLMVAGAWIGSKSHVFLSKAHPDVYLAELLISHPELKSDLKNIDIQTFLASGKSLETLVADAQVIRDKFYTGSWILGAFLGW